MKVILFECILRKLLLNKKSNVKENNIQLHRMLLSYKVMLTYSIETKLKHQHKEHKLINK